MKKNSKKYILIFTITIILVTILLSPYFFIKIQLIGDKKIVLNYGDEYNESGYLGKLLKKDITQDIKITNTIKEQIGKYKVIYSYKFLFYNIKQTRIVEVKDIKGPKIELTDGTTYEVIENEIYLEPGFIAIDNKDGDVTNKVEVKGTVDTTKLGEYKIKYEVSDSNNNQTNVTRTVKVVKKNPLQMSVLEYNLDGWYDEVKLKETENKGNEYFNKITMVGDSNTMNMYLNGYLNGIRAWAIPCLHASTMHSWDINLYGLGLKMKLIDAVKTYQPEIMILNLGTFSTTWIQETTFIDKANLIIEQIKETSPNTKLILSSIYPIKKGENINKFTQEKINRYNFLILEMANKHKVKYLDIAGALKDETGYGNPLYFVEDNFHLTLLGHSTVKEYIKTHALEEE